MRSDAKTVEDYIDSIDPKWKQMVEKLREALKNNLPEGYEETMSYGMIGYVIPHSLYPTGYHVDPKEPLPFINLAAQKNNVSLYHNGIYGDPELEKWFTENYKEAVGKKPDMGKSCIRFKKETDIPFGLLEELFSKIQVDDYIEAYEKAIKKR